MSRSEATQSEAIGTGRIVAVTGVSGHVGQRLLRLLDADHDVVRVIGIDARDPRFRPHKLAFHRVDVASADLKPLLEEADVVVHLAWSATPAHDMELLARVNVEATRRLLDAAGSTGVRHLVMFSSAMVYGAWPDNPLPLTEDALVRPNPGVAYAAHKAEAERLIADWKADHPGVTATILRPAAAPGANSDCWLTRLWRGLPVRVRGAAPPVQYVHEDDLASAAALATRASLDGVFNVAPDGWVPGDDAAALAAGFRLSLPERVVDLGARIGWSTGMTDIAPGALAYAAQPWVVANDRLKAAGWVPSHSNEEAYVASAELPRWRRIVGRHRQEVALGAAATGLAGVTAGVVALIRRGRKHRG
jgi:nucleoside-diphosphate-sugar epimerase